ncbi:MAG: hypothetical protein AB8E15_12565 [Bdellovibrionales bacterium]
MNLLKWVSLLFLSISVSGLASTESGNTSFDFDTSFRMSTKHPEHDELIKMLYDVELPSEFKRTLINDLSSTLVLYSSENLTYKDFLSEVRMELVERKKTITIVNGEVTEVLKERWISIEESKDYGIYPNLDHKIKVDEMEDVQLSAITTMSPKQVIYFTPVTKEMTRDQRLKLVLHEQAHRLASLFDRRDHDERFIRSWAHSFLAYLKKQTSKDDFYRLLTQLGIPTIEINEYENVCEHGQCFPNETLQDGGLFESIVPIVLNSNNLIAYGIDGKKFNIVLSRNVFIDYPPLYAIDNDIQISLDVKNQEEYLKLNEFYNGIKNQSNSYVKYFRVRYRKEFVRLSDGNYVTKYKYLNTHAYHPEYEQVKQNISERSSSRTQKYISLRERLWHRFFDYNSYSEERVAYATEVWDVLMKVYKEMDIPARYWNLIDSYDAEVNYFFDRKNKESILIKLVKEKEGDLKSIRFYVNLAIVLSEEEIRDKVGTKTRELTHAYRRKISVESKLPKLQNDSKFIIRTAYEDSETFDEYMKLHLLLWQASSNFHLSDSTPPFDLFLGDSCEYKNQFYSRLYFMANNRYSLILCIPNELLRSKKTLRRVFRILRSPSNYSMNRSKDQSYTYKYRYKLDKDGFKITKKQKIKTGNDSYYINNVPGAFDSFLKAALEIEREEDNVWNLD